MSHLENNKILYNLQHGFRKARSCETQLIDFIQNRIGPRTLPWGTPDVTGTYVEEVPFMTTV
jgi:hypothetical protein